MTQAESRSSRCERVEKITRGGNTHNYCNNIVTCSDFLIGVLQYIRHQHVERSIITQARILRIIIYLFRAATADCGGGDDDDKTNARAYYILYIGTNILFRAPHRYIREYK